MLKPDVSRPRFCASKPALRWISVFYLSLLTVACGQKAPAPEAPAQAPEQQQAQQPPAQQEADAVELEYWKTIKDSEHTDDFWSYLEKYPNGAFADLAKSRIERLSSGEKPKATAEKKTQTSSSTGGSGNIRSQRKDVVRSAIRSELRGYSDRRLHIAPDIPRFKLDNVAELHGLDPRRVILLYDDGSGGGGKTGFCLTDRRIYWRLIAGSDPYFIDYEDISHVRVGRSGFTVNGYEIPTTLASNSRLAAERFGDLVERISRDMQRR